MAHLLLVLVAEKTYPDGTYAALFRDRNNRCLQVLWREEGRSDVLVPLPGVNQVELIRIDGRRRQLDAAGQGLTLTVGPDPLILFYDGPEAVLAADLEKPAAEVIVTLNSAESVEAIVPPLWKVEKEIEKPRVKFSLAVPDESTACEADLIFSPRDGPGRSSGEFSLRPAVAGRLAVRIFPEPVTKDTPAGVRLSLANNGSQPQSVKWEAPVTESLSLKQGHFGAPSAPDADIWAQDGL